MENYWGLNQRWWTWNSDVGCWSVIPSERKRSLRPWKLHVQIPFVRTRRKSAAISRRLSLKCRAKTVVNATREVARYRRTVVIDVNHAVTARIMLANCVRPRHRQLIKLNGGDRLNRWRITNCSVSVTWHRRTTPVKGLVSSADEFSSCVCVKSSSLDIRQQAVRQIHSVREQLEFGIYRTMKPNNE